MEAKVLVPVVTLAGTVAGVWAGVKHANSGSSILAKSEIVRDWEIDVADQVSVELPCTGKLWERGSLSRNYINTLFRWTLPLNVGGAEIS